jgi:hypothetical protein
MEMLAIDPKVLGLAAILIPLVTSFLKSAKAPDWVQSIIYGTLCFLAAAAAFALQLRIGDIPGDAMGRFDYALGAFLQILLVSQAFYRGLWKPTGADAVVARVGPKLGAGVDQPTPYVASDPKPVVLPAAPLERDPDEDVSRETRLRDEPIGHTDAFAPRREGAEDREGN